jgi:hypothetical protein
MPDYFAHEFLNERHQRISQELAERLDEWISERDICAVQTALSKALAAGFNEGVACVTIGTQVTDSDGGVHDLGAIAGVQERMHISESDEWLERYGDDD